MCIWIPTQPQPLRGINNTTFLDPNSTNSKCCGRTYLLDLLWVALDLLAMDTNMTDIPKDMFEGAPPM